VAGIVWLNSSSEQIMRKTSYRLRAIVFGAVCVFALGGCNNCEKMVEKLCNDLGPADCALWKKSGLDRSLVPEGRKVNSACGTMMSDTVYPGVLKGARTQVEALKKVEAAKAKANIH
jgi:hypothetical protein